MIERKTVIDGYMNEESNIAGGIAATIVAGGTIYFSGLAAIGPDHEVVAPDDMAGQLAYCLELLERGLHDVGADWSNLVNIVVYVTDEEAYMENYGLITEKLGGNLVTSTSIGVPNLAMPGLVVEIVPIGYKG